MFQFPDAVRVIRLLSPDRPLIGTVGLARPPELGDIGTVVASSPEHGRFQVEVANRDGATLCLADFIVDELEPVRPDKNAELHRDLLANTR